MIATVTLPAGRTAVVHAELMAWGATVLETEGGRDALRTAVIEDLRVDASCAAARESEPDVTITDWQGGGLWAEARVLCTDPACRADAEAYEQELGDHPDARAARAWAVAQAGTQAAR